MGKPILVVMAAGLGSRYGGLKQADPVGPSGEILLDYSVYDAIRAGFEKIIFIIKKEHRALFEEHITKKFPASVEVCFADQELSDIPKEYELPEGRVKPWGTAHAIWAARALIDGPFTAINADDYYGTEAFRKMYQKLCATAGQPGAYAMVAYPLCNTMTENGSVSRGICDVTPEGLLLRVTERTEIYQNGSDGRYTEDGGKTFTDLSGDTLCSMNFWGFQADFLDAIAREFRLFLDRALTENPMKSEFYLPSVVTAQLNAGRAHVEVLTSRDRWFGVTYAEDKKTVVQGLRALVEQGVYPENLWGSV